MVERHGSRPAVLHGLVDVELCLLTIDRNRRLDLATPVPLAQLLYSAQVLTVVLAKSAEAMRLLLAPTAECRQTHLIQTHHFPTAI